MRSPVRWRVGLCLWAVLAAAPGARAQERPHIGYIYPAGGRQGTVAEIAVGGQYLAGATGAHVSGKGVRTKVVRYTRALTNSQLNQLGMKLAEVRQFQVRAMAAKNKGSKAGLLMVKAAEEFTLLAARLGLKDPTPKGYAELRKKLADPKRQPNPQLGETVILEITVAPDAEPGERELRLETPAGVTNPLYLRRTTRRRTAGC